MCLIMLNRVGLLGLYGPARILFAASVSSGSHVNSGADADRNTDNATPM